MAAMRDDTPYSDRPATEVAREQHCMREIFGHAGPVSHIWETFAGLGITAEVLREKFPEADIVGTDLDEDCVQTYNGKGYGTAYRRDALEHLKMVPVDDHGNLGVSMDYNKFTVFDLRETRGKAERWKLDLIRGVLDRQPRWVQLTDSACRYLHLNWGNYELEANDIHKYIQAVEKEFRAQPGGRAYRLCAWSKHSAASYLLFVRD